MSVKGSPNPSPPSADLARSLRTSGASSPARVPSSASEGSSPFPLIVQAAPGNSVGGFEQWDFPSHIYEIAAPEAERGYIAFNPAVDGSWGIRRKWFTADAVIRREELTVGLALGPDPDLRAVITDRLAWLPRGAAATGASAITCCWSRCAAGTSSRSCSTGAPTPPGWPRTCPRRKSSTSAAA